MIEILDDVELPIKNTFPIRVANTSKRSGIYKITNKTNNKFYIGSACNLALRFNVHSYELCNDKHHSQYLQRAWNKHGAGNFEFEVLQYCETSELLKLEQIYLDCYQPQYNILKTAGSNIGHFPSNLTRQKMSIAQTGRKHSEETKRKMSESVKGLNKGRKLSEETKRKMSEARKGSNNGNFGNKHSAETKAKMSKALKGREAHNAGTPISEEQREKISNTLKKSNCQKYILSVWRCAL